MSGKDKKAQKSKKIASNEQLEKSGLGMLLLYKAIDIIEYREMVEENKNQEEESKLENSWKSDQMTFLKEKLDESGLKELSH